jgi:hypothetical protein
MVLNTVMRKSSDLSSFVSLITFEFVLEEIENKIDRFNMEYNITGKTATYTAAKNNYLQRRKTIKPQKKLLLIKQGQNNKKGSPGDRLSLLPRTVFRDADALRVSFLS